MTLNAEAARAPRSSGRSNGRSTATHCNREHLDLDLVVDQREHLDLVVDLVVDLLQHTATAST